MMGILAKEWLRAMSKQKDLLPASHQSGYGLLGALMTIGIISMAYTFNTTLMVNQMKFNAHIEVGQDFEALRNYVRGRLDCTKTKAVTPAACSSNTEANIPLYDASNNMFVSATYTDTMNRVGSYQVYAVCSGPTTALAGKVVKVRARKLAPDGTVMKDPLTGAVLDWQDIFSVVPVACSW